MRRRFDRKKPVDINISSIKYDTTRINITPGGLSLDIHTHTKSANKVKKETKAPIKQMQIILVDKMVRD